MMKRIHFYLLITSGIFPIALISSDFHLITQSKSYSDAKTHCRDFYGDLATVHNRSDMNNLISLASNVTIRAWIGLENGRVWMWHWSQPHQKLGYFNWRAEEPQNNSQDGCAALDERGEWFDSDCTDRRSFICRGIGGTGAHTFVAEAKSWRDAQSHCRNLVSDLVSIQSAQENQAVLTASAAQSVWIGLFKDPWKWSDGSPSSFRYWKPSQPNYRQGQDCVAAVFRDQGKWNDRGCKGKHHFVCRGAKKHLPITTSPVGTQEPITMTLNTPQNTEAPVGTQEPHRTTLNASQSTAAPAGTQEPITMTLNTPQNTEAPVGTQEPHRTTLNASQSTAAPVGTQGPITMTLNTPQNTEAPVGTQEPHRTTLNASQSTAAPVGTQGPITMTLNTPQNTEAPVGTQEPHRTTLNASQSTAAPVGTQEPITMTLNTPQNTEAPVGTQEPHRTTLNAPQSTAAPAGTQGPLRTTLNALQNTTTAEIWTHLTVSASTNTTKATPQAANISQLTPNTTDGVTGSPATLLDNATAAVLTTTWLQATDAFSVVTTMAATTAEPSTNISSVRSGNLILVRENLTWMQAMTYCRKHHLDLVHITTQDVQEKVAAIAKNSTSTHVWIGLRYTCQFNFWFWTSSAPSCYQNWAPGHGPQRNYDCRVTGAVEATGGQQWVGLPDRERLNFICSACAG